MRVVSCLCLSGLWSLALAGSQMHHQVTMALSIPALQLTGLIRGIPPPPRASNTKTHEVRKERGYFHSSNVLWTCIFYVIKAEWPIYASGNYTTIGSDNGLLPVWQQAIIWTNAGILLTGPLKMNFSEIFMEIHKFSSNKMHLKMSAKITTILSQPQCVNANEVP